MQQPKLRFQRGPRSGGEREGAEEERGRGEEASIGAQKTGGVGVGRRRGPFFPTLRAGGEERVEGKGSLSSSREPVNTGRETRSAPVAFLFRKRAGARRLVAAGGAGHVAAQN